MLLLSILKKLLAMKAALLALLMLCAAALINTRHLIIETAGSQEKMEDGLDYADTDTDEVSDIDTDANTGITLTIKAFKFK